jgi:hypothetical protein
VSLLFGAKKKQKAPPCIRTEAKMDKSFFGSFFSKKELLPY